MSKSWVRVDRYQHMIDDAILNGNSPCIFYYQKFAPAEGPQLRHRIKVPALANGRLCLVALGQSVRLYKAYDPSARTTKVSRGI